MRGMGNQYKMQLSEDLKQEKYHKNLQEEQMTSTGDRRFQNPQESENNKQVRPIS